MPHPWTNPCSTRTNHGTTNQPQPPPPDFWSSCTPALESWCFLLCGSRDSRGNTGATYLGLKLIGRVARHHSHHQHLFRHPSSHGSVISRSGVQGAPIPLRPFPLQLSLPTTRPRFAPPLPIHRVSRVSFRSLSIGSLCPAQGALCASSTSHLVAFHPISPKHRFPQPIRCFDSR
ncbi:hypothetical protein LY76DRAFT_404116 [Colletotrichum caudatum]|nr:hypothetical protein LY76DRAFT_404116 [Colletotrichum caudatum]